MNVAGKAAMALAALGYLGAAVGYQRALFSPGPQDWERWRRWLLGGLALHSLGLALLTAALGHFPASGLAESTGSLAWFVVLLYLLIGPRWNIQVIGAVAAPAASALTALSLTALGAGGQGGPSPGRWIAVHVISVVLGYGAFTLASICAGLYLLQARLLKRKRIAGLFRKLPPLVTLDAVAYRLILLGFLPMIAGVVTGMFLMQASAGVLWSWDPKQTMVALTGALYLIYLHARLLAGWQGRRVNVLLLAGFLCVLVSYLAPGDFHRF